MNNMNMPQIIKRTKLHEQVAHTLSLKILKNELPPDSFLPNEDTLSKQFGVSKPVIREAINFMDAKGLVQARPRIGTRICNPVNWVLTDPMLLKWQMEAGPEKSFILELLELRIIIEPTGAGLAAQRATKEDIKKIEEALKQMGGATSIDEHIDADIKFHLSIIEASQNKLLISSLKPVIENTLGSSFHQFIQSLDAAKESVPVHAEVVKAIIKKDPEGAIFAMKKIIERSAHDIEDIDNLNRF